MSSYVLETYWVSESHTRASLKKYLLMIWTQWGILPSQVVGTQTAEVDDAEEYDDTAEDEYFYHSYFYWEHDYVEGDVLSLPDGTKIMVSAYVQPLVNARMSLTPDALPTLLI